MALFQNARGLYCKNRKGLPFPHCVVAQLHGLGPVGAGPAESLLCTLVLVLLAPPSGDQTSLHSRVSRLGT